MLVKKGCCTSLTILESVDKLGMASLIKWWYHVTWEAIPIGPRVLNLHKAGQEGSIISFV